MSPVATYSFLPWYRRGVANTIQSADGDHGVHGRVTTHVELTLVGEPVTGSTELTQTLAQDIALYGPGDLVGVDGRAVVRTEPRNWITNFEANYLAAVDFYDEDFPWRYTPAAADAAHLKLRPWITLVVLTEQEFGEATNVQGRPLPYITIPDTSVLPPAGDLWAWAHVHFNLPLSANPQEIVSTDVHAVLGRAESILAQNPDAAYARLLCPRRLDDNTAYHAFVVPTFESGRLAGVGADPTTAPYATASAWEAYAGRLQGAEFPYYFRWYFRTGSHGDFLYLVRLLQPQPVDPRVGIRDMDTQRPGSNVPGFTGLGGVLRLGGALQVPVDDLDDVQKAQRQQFEDWDQPYPDAFEQSLAAFINLPDDYEAQSAADANAATGLGAGIDDDPDPLITAPLYGRWHALTQRLLTQRDGTPAPNTGNWVHRVNLDPRFRVPAGFGADVVETNAEPYMNDAWQQIGDVLAANQKIRNLHLAVEASSQWFVSHLTPLAQAAPDRSFALTAPVHARVLGSPTTVAHVRRTSLVQPVLTSTAFRRVVRPRARLIRSLPFTADVTPTNLLTRVNNGHVTAAPPKTVPGGVVTVDEVSAAAEPANVPGWLRGLLLRFPWLPWALIALGILLLVVLALAGSLIAGLVALAVLLALAVVALRLRTEGQPALSLEEGDQSPSAVGDLPSNPAFTITAPGTGLSTPTGTIDSAVAANFKRALTDSFTLLDASRTVGRPVELGSLDLVSLNSTVVTALNPRVTIFQRGLTTISLPSWIGDLLVDDFGEVMAYPRIDLPMYEPLKEISVELFLPNINLIAPNSITLVETNQRFIESYMVGLNHEFARKLLWREYPTDQRGSYFRQFWDVRSVINTEGLSEDALREQLYDIPELHRWPPASTLGSHNNRQSADEQGEQAVLVIRGELLKKYPTAVIYANRADWEYEADGHTPDLTKPRKLVPLLPAEEAEPPPDKVRSPLYEAKADPDIYFFGFDLTIPEAKGGSGHPPDTDPGWFFVIKERPGEPRFGLELTRDANPEVLDELTWDDAIPGGNPGDFLSAGSLANVGLTHPPAGDPEGKEPQYEDDEQADATAESAARWAYLLFRPPVMVAIHADEMLRDQP